MERKYGLIFCEILLLFSMFSGKVYASPQQENMSVTQVNAVMPDVDVYLNQAIPDVENVTAFLGEKELEFQGSSTASEESFHYFLLLDISASISSSDFQNIKTGTEFFLEQLRESDQISIYTFGDEVKEIYTGNPSNAQMEVGKLVNRDQNTLLFEAIERAANQASSDIDNQRKVIIVITDGEDFAFGKTTQQETTESLSEKGFSVYAIVPDIAQKEDVNSFGEFIRSTGGELLVTDGEKYGDVLHGLDSSLKAATVLHFTGESNRVSNQIEKLVLTIDGQPVMKDILVSKWKPDETAPQITEVKRDQEQILQVEFSEKVLNATQISSWQVSRDGKILPIESVSCQMQDGNFCAQLFFSVLLYGGNYKIECIGITDDSQEENELSSEYEIVLEGDLYQEENTGRENTKWIVLIILVIISAVIVAFICGLFLYRKLKKNNGVIYLEGKPVLVSHIKKHEKISLEHQKGKKIQIFVDIDGQNTRVINAIIDKSLFFGRASVCDYYFDDPSLSKQHFALEYDGEQLFITDLESKNGTRVNGILIKRRHRLQPDDVIMAGALHFRIKM